MSNKNEILELYYLAQKYKLEGREILDKYSFEDLAKIYNGIGPDAFPEWLRTVVTKLHPSLGPVALIHDVEWHESDRTSESFTESNERFKRNGATIAKGMYSFFNPRRYIVKNQAYRFGCYCEHLGWHAWCTPCECPICKQVKANG